jgi:hypothetical protein
MADAVDGAAQFRARDERYESGVATAQICASVKVCAHV